MSERIQHVAYFAAWGLLFYGIIISCLFIGCQTHSVVGYSVLAGLAPFVLGITLTVLFAIFTDVNQIIMLIMTGILMVFAGLWGGFVGLTWDGYCAMQGPTMYNATAMSPVDYPNIWKFEFNENVQLLTSFETSNYIPSSNGKYGYYNSGGYSFNGAFLVECPANYNSSQVLKCVYDGVSYPTGTILVAHCYSYWGNTCGPNWPNFKTVKQAVRVHDVFDMYYKNLPSAMSSTYANYFNIPKGLVYLHGSSFEEAETKWRANAIGTLCGAVINGLLFLIVPLIFSRL